MNKIKLKQGEAKKLTFTIKDADGKALDVSGATLTFWAKKKKTDIAPILAKEDETFDKSQAANGIVTTILDSSDTNIEPGLYIAELKIYFSSTNIDKSADIHLEIKRAVTD